MSSENITDIPANIIDLKDFETLGQIGRGGFFQVFLVQDKKTGKQYAAKRSLFDQKDENNPASTEIKAYLRLDHPAIVSFIGYGFDKNNNLTIITDYIKNTLEKVLRNPEGNQLTNTNKYIILLGTAVALKYIHSKGVIHRNIKPRKILLDEKLYPHVCGFTISCTTDQELTKTEMNETSGTYIYMAPERCEGNQYSYKVDSYSFAILMYETLANKPPFENYQNMYYLVRDIVDGVRPDINLVEIGKMRQLIENCWSGDPSQRPNFIEIVDEMKSEEMRREFSVNESERCV